MTAQTKQKQPVQLWLLAICYFFFSAGQGFALGLVIPYMQGQFHIGTESAYEMFSAVMSLYFTMPLLGGYLAGRIGYKFTAVTGIVTGLVAYILMIIPSLEFFRYGLALFIIGESLAIPALYCLLSNVYSKRPNQREGGFTIMYLLSNLSMFIFVAIANTLAYHLGYKLMFISISVFILLSLLILIFSYRQLADQIENLKRSTPSKPKSLGFLILAILVGSFVCDSLFKHPIICNVIIWALFALVIISIIYMASTETNKKNRAKLLVFLILCVFSVFFWSLYMLEPALLTEFVSTQVNLIVDNFAIPNGSVFSLDSLFVVVTGLVLSRLWPYLAKRKKNPSLPVKFASALIFMALGFIILAFLVKFNGLDNKLNVAWFLLVYFFLTFGELLIGPIGFSMVGRLSSPKNEGYLMGVWQFCIGVAGAFALILEQMAVTPDKVKFATANHIYMASFFKIGGMAFIIGLIAFAMVPTLKKMMEHKA